MDTYIESSGDELGEPLQYRRVLNSTPLHSQPSSSTQDVEIGDDASVVRSNRSRGYNWTLEAERVVIEVLIAACRSGGRERGSTGFKSTYYQQAAQALITAGFNTATRQQIKSKVDTVCVNEGYIKYSNIKLTEE